MKIRRTKHILIIVVFVVAAAICAYLSGGVGINYNLSDYLAEDTETKISLEIIDREFGNACDIQVMIDGITAKRSATVTTVGVYQRANFVTAFSALDFASAEFSTSSRILETVDSEKQRVTRR